MCEPTFMYEPTHEEIVGDPFLIWDQEDRESCAIYTLSVAQCGNQPFEGTQKQRNKLIDDYKNNINRQWEATSYKPGIMVLDEKSKQKRKSWFHQNPCLFSALLTNLPEIIEKFLQHHSVMKFLPDKHYKRIIDDLRTLRLRQSIDTLTTEYNNHQYQN